MANIPHPQDEDLPDDVWRVVNAVPPLNLIRIMAWAPGNLESVVRLSDSVLNRSDLDPVLRQVALIRLTVVVGSRYEQTMLESVSEGLGMDEPLMEAARRGSTAPGLSELQQMAAKLAEELAGAPRPSAETFAYLKAHLSTRHLVELVQAIGFYLMQTRTIETFAIEHEDPPVDLARRMDGAVPEALALWRAGRGPISTAERGGGAS